MTPELTSNVLVPSDTDELESRLKALFASHVKGLMEGKEVKRLVEEKDRLSKEIQRVSWLLSKPLSIPVLTQKREEKKGLETEKNLIEMRLKEFRNAMECVLKYMNGENKVDDDGVAVFRFHGKNLDWNRIHCLIMRELRRLEQGLPVYAYRSHILQEIHYQQVCFITNFKILFSNLFYCQNQGFKL